MDVSTLLDGLNDKQRDAVAAPVATCWCWPVPARARPGCWCTVSPG